MRHQTLIQTKSLLDKFLVIMTNQAYAHNRKFGYRISWLKGTQQIDDGSGNITKNYYHLRFYLVDKTNSPIGKEVDLLNNFYALSGLQSIEKLEEQAYEELLLNGLRSLFNITYAHYLEDLEKDIVTLKDVQADETLEMLRNAANEEKPKLFVGHDIRPNNSEDNKPNIIRG